MIKKILEMSAFSNFLPSQMLMAPWVSTMDTSGPLTSMQAGSVLPLEELGMKYQTERSRYNHFEITARAEKILQEE